MLVRKPQFGVGIILPNTWISKKNANAKDQYYNRRLSNVVGVNCTLIVLDIYY